MTEQIMSVDALQTYLITMFPAQQVRVRRRDSVVTIEPADEEADCTIALRGMFKDCPDMSVDRFLERKHADTLLEIKREQEEYSCPLLGSGVGSKLTVDRFLEMTREAAQGAAGNRGVVEIY